MPSLIVVAGVLLLIGGAVTVGLGLPYLVLERGFTQVIVGSVAAFAGLILIVLGVVLGDLRRLRAMIPAACAETNGEGRTEPAPDMAGAVPAVAANEPLASGVEGPDLASAVAVGALAGAGGAAGSIVKDSSSEAEPVEDVAAETPAGDRIVAADDADADITPAADALPERDPDAVPQNDEVISEHEAPVAGVDDSAAEPSAADIVVVEPDASEESGSEVPEVQAPRRDADLGADEAPPILLDREMPPIEDHPAPDDPLAEPPSSAPTPDDEFAALRQSLRNITGEISGEPQPLREPMEEEAAQPQMSEEPTAVVESESAPPETETVAAPTESEPAPEPPVSGPAVSREGIVSVRKMGDSTFTMFQDGTILAETPAGSLRFASLAELKAHLAQPRI